MKIPISVDGSEYTQRAINYYLDHKQSFGKFGSVTLFHVSALLPKLINALLSNETIENHYGEEVEKSMAWGARALPNMRRPMTKRSRLARPL